jgi:hypothetical protein
MAEPPAVAGVDESERPASAAAPPHEASILIAAPPDVLYDMVADVTRMGEWSPICTGGAWDRGSGPTVGGRFTGRNVTAEHSWETRCRVTAAERGRRFAFTVESVGADWTYTFATRPGYTLVTESWALRPEGVENYRRRFGDEADHQITVRRRRAVEGIARTLRALKHAAEQQRVSGRTGRH